MSLEMRKTSQWFYGRWQAHGKKHCKNLNVKIAGKRPASLAERGDKAFEKSRIKAEAELHRLQEESRRKVQAEDLVQALYKIRTGEDIGSVALAELPDRWSGLRRTRKLSEEYRKTSRRRLQTFADFIRKKYGKDKEMIDVTPRMAEAFLKAEEKRGVSSKTWNDILILLRSAFHKLKREAGITENPFDGIPTKEKDTVHRIPFSPADLNTILAAAEDDDFARPLIVTGMCTAMRLGDCCLLKRTDVDLENGFIRVKTSKTGETVEIPVFPLLCSEMEEWLAREEEGEFVFPEQADTYRSNRWLVTQRLQKVFRAAGFKDDADEEEKRPRAQRESGLIRASVRDFHSFRVTWVTLALTAGVPMELVQKVT